MWASRSAWAAAKRTAASSSTKSTFRSSGIRLSRRGSRRCRQLDDELGPALGAVAGAQRPAVLPHDPLGDGEAEAEAGLLGGEERLEEARQHVGRDPGAVVGHRDPRPPVGPTGRDLDPAVLPAA